MNSGIIIAVMTKKHVIPIFHKITLAKSLEYFLKKFTLKLEALLLKKNLASMKSYDGLK